MGGRRNEACLFEFNPSNFKSLRHSSNGSLLQGQAGHILPVNAPPVYPRVAVTCTRSTRDLFLSVFPRFCSSLNVPPSLSGAVKPRRRAGARGRPSSFSSWTRSSTSSRVGVFAPPVQMQPHAPPPPPTAAAARGRTNIRCNIRCARAPSTRAPSRAHPPSPQRGLLTFCRQRAGARSVLHRISAGGGPVRRAGVVEPGLEPPARHRPCRRRG